jgi:hypothetical protein
VKRRTVKKITPARTASFDQQFWPIVIAVTVLCGIALGAVLTILRGPWMWGSLLLLPLMAAGALFFLFQLDDTRLRRSFQLAIVCSLAAHMAVLVFASVVNIFDNPFKPKQREIAQQPVRTIEISDQRATFVWEETNNRTTPEPKVEQQRTKPSTNTRPQTVPIKEEKPDLQPQIVKRDTPSESVPRQNRELSRLRRQTESQQPRSSQKVEGVTKTEPTKTQPAKKQPEVAKSQPAPATAEREPTIERQTAVERELAEAANPTAPETTPKPEITRSTPRPQKTQLADASSDAIPKPSSSDARIFRSAPKIPTASKAVPVSEKIAKATSKARVEPKPSKASAEVTRREVKREIQQPASTNTPKTQRSPKPQIARSTSRAVTKPLPPSISAESSREITPRRSTVQAPLASSPVSIEKPSRAPESKSTTNELKSKTLSVSRSTEGLVGVGRAQNLDRFVGGITSPASRASDSARRERTQSAANEQRMLISSSRAELRRSIGATRTPTSAFKAETSSAAKISGTLAPSERSLESSAASINSASTEHRDALSAEKGSSNIDLGPTKVVRDRVTRRRSGGGQPEVSRLNPDRTRRSRDRSDQQPSLVASSGVEVAAPKNASSQPSAAEALELSSRDVTVARSGGKQEITFEESSANSLGEALDMGQSDLVEQFADARQRSSREESFLAWDEDEEDEDEENRRGKSRTKIAVAPVTRGDAGFGIAKSDGVASTKSDKTGDAAGESLAARMTKQATASVPGTGLGQTTANMLLQAATSLPIIDAAPGERAARAPTKSKTVSEGVAANQPRRRATRGSMAPKSSSGVSPAIGEMAKGTTSGSASIEMESAEVAVERATESMMEEIQGISLDVIAEVGPAGLADRPDSYIGVVSRPASKDSKQIQPDRKNRFRKSVFGGVPAINPDAVVSKEAFRNRSPSALSKATEPTTEAAIHLGLEFLARHQSTDGSWSLTIYDREETQHLTQLDSDTAGTGLALLAFQGAGYNHREFKYARQIDHAIQWLIENQSADGGLYVPSDKKSNGACRLYSHGIAALAITEAYGMTQDVRLKEPAQKALDYIMSSQDETKGGWRYFDTPGMKSSDTSVSGWMMMALQSGRLAGLDVKSKTFDGIDNWLDVAVTAENESQFRYNPYAVNSKGVSRIQGRKPTPSMTSVGLLMRIYSGWKPGDPRLLAGADYLLNQQLPSDSTPILRDTYYWYYATQVLKYAGGERWERWNQQLRPLLIRSQVKTGDLAGSWNPYRPVPDRWGSFGGRLYVTTMNLLSLEVRHRMLPLYRQGEPQVAGQIEPMPETESVSTKRPPEPKVEPKKTPPPKVVSKPEPKKPEPKKIEPEVIEPKVVKAAPKAEPKAPPVMPKREPKAEPKVASVTPKVDPKKIEPKKVEPKKVEPKIVLSQPEMPKVEPPKKKAEPKITPEVVRDPEPKIEPVQPKPEPKIEPKPTMEPAKPSAIEPEIIISDAPESKTELAEKQPAEPPTISGEMVPVKPDAAPKSEPKVDVAEPKKPQPSKEPKPNKTAYTSVSGSVTLDGQKLKNARIELIPADKKQKPVVGKTNNLGLFTIAPSVAAKSPGVLPGSYTVSITTFFESSDLDVIDLLEIVPEKYNKKSKVKVEVKPTGRNVFNFKLKTE